MTKRNSVTVTLNGSVQVYYANMVDDVEASIKRSIVDSAGVMPVITDAHVLRHIIADYFILKYGQDERKKIREVFFAKDFEELEQQQMQIAQKYA